MHTGVPLSALPMTLYLHTLLIMISIRTLSAAGSCVEQSLQRSHASIHTISLYSGKLILLGLHKLVHLLDKLISELLNGILQDLLFIL